MNKLLFSLSNAAISFGGGKNLFEDLSFNIHQYDKICLIGNNGAGKSTLMKIALGQIELDHGKIFQTPDTTIGYLEQNPKINQQQQVKTYLQEDIDVEQEYLIKQIIQPFEVDLDAVIGNLSGGQLRKITLAKLLLQNPNILLLDEPTNHLDLKAIQWLENYIKKSKNTIICISHDRQFLKNISNKVFWLDRGNLKTCPKGYDYFETWREMLLGQEKRELENRQATMDIEDSWASKGVKARVKRNVRRLDDFKREKEQLEQDQSKYRNALKDLQIKEIKFQKSSKLIGQFINVGKKFGNKVILDKFNLKIMQGDKIGIIGDNGCGKTSFLKLLTKEIDPDCGSIKLGKTIEFSYFDQDKSQLKDSLSIGRNLSENSDYINVAGKQRHVCSYLKDFLFDPKQSGEPITILSGGQQNRLLLAKTLANPRNCLILDEPTNDLDMQTLDILQNILGKYQGTTFIVSHDRDFLDRCVNKIIIFKKDAPIEVSLGNYSSYLSMKKDQLAVAKHNKKEQKGSELRKKPQSYKLTYKLEFELKQIPQQIEQLTKELHQINQKLIENNQSDIIEQESIKAAKINQKIESLENRWLEIEEMKEG